MKIIYILLFIGLISCALLSSEVACAEDLQLNDDAILALLINENEEDEDEEDGDVMSKTFKEKFIRQRTLHLFNRKKLAKRAAKSATIGRSITNWVPRKKVINTPTGETIDTGGAVITPMSPEAGQIAAQGWLAKELGLEEKEIESLGYTSLDEPKNMGNGLVRHTSGASRYMFRFAVSGQRRTEYLISGAWDLSVPPQDQKWIQIGTTIIGMTSGEGNLSIGNTEEETDDPGITKVPPVNELPVPTEYPKEPDFSEIPPKVPGITKYPPEKVVDTPDEETITIGGAVIAPMSPEAGQIAAQGWLAKELGLEEKNIVSLGYMSPDEPKNMKNGFVRHIAGASRYMFKFAVSGQEGTEYLINGAWDLSVGPQDQKWIQIGTTIVGMTSGEDNLSVEFKECLNKNEIENKKATSKETNGYTIMPTMAGVDNKANQLLQQN